jgi:periplasmic divalent cation tolerance protein
VVLDPSGFIVVLTTLGSVEEARRVVRALVERQLIACGTIFPGAASIYRWEGRLTEETEAVVLMKTRREQWEQLSAATKALHPYKVPELLALTVEAGLPAYLDWVRSETIPGKEG